MTSPLLHADNLSFSYHPDRPPALRSIPISLSPGEVVTLIGPNGSGKSTLIKSLLGHLHASGQISWSGKPLSQWRRRDLAKILAYLPQSPNCELGQTVADVLRLGRAPYWGAFGLESSADQSVVTDVARLLNLTEFLDRPMDELSGGQRQRAFIGRCLAQQPSALLLDEPNTYLDLKGQVELGQLLRQLSRKKNLAVLMASHELNTAAAFSDRLILLSNGQLASTGAPHEVLRPDILQPVYNIPIESFTAQGGSPVVIATEKP